MKLYNTLTRKCEEFKPLNPPKVSIYVCGPTVYDDPHIGHARSAFIFDVLRKYLAYRNYQVKFVRNVTDVDDKIIDKAKKELALTTQQTAHCELKDKCAEIATRYLESYHKTMDRLGIMRPDVEPKATDHVIPDESNVKATNQIDTSVTGFISQLITKNAAYPAGGNVYFSVRKFSGYGKLSNRSIDELKVGARVMPGEDKQDPLDFALWKAAKPGEPFWNSPWGPGRPGWHIECSVMSTAYLGDAFDIHGGGVDLLFPHHENEAAQAQAAGKPFARYWIHNGLLTVDGEKMSKSLGNYTTVDKALQACGGEVDALKMFFLSANYRSPLDYTKENIQAARGRYEGLQGFLNRAQGLPVTESRQERLSVIAQAEDKFGKAMDDDMNTPMALAALDELANAGYASLEVYRSGRTCSNKSDKQSMSDPAYDVVSIASVIQKLGAVLGLFSIGTEKVSAPPEILSRVEAREKARTTKDFAAADRLRDEVSEMGYVIEDTPRGPVVLPKK